MDSHKVGLNNSSSGGSHAPSKKRGHRSHSSGNNSGNGQNHLENHPMFQRRQSRIEKKKGRNYFGWLRIIPQAIVFVSKRIMPKKKAIDPNAPVLGLRETQELRKLAFTGSERKKLLMLFKEMTGSKRNTASFRAFTRYFRLAPDVWAMRAFEIMNHQLTGAVSFLEFAAFLMKYLVVDKELTEEFCFRLLSRRGITFMPEYSILDLEDFLTIVTFRYKEFTSLPVQKKVAMDLFSFVDADNDGGVSIAEFRAFSAKNPVLLRMAHLFLNHLRKCIFGLDFWVEKTRHWKAKQATALQIALLAQRNVESETYFGQVLKEPVVDGNGNPLTNDYYQRQYDAKKRADDEQRLRLQQQQAMSVILAASSAQHSLTSGGGGAQDDNMHMMGHGGGGGGSSVASDNNNSHNQNHSKTAPSLASMDRSLGQSQSMLSTGNNSNFQLGSRANSFMSGAGGGGGDSLSRDASFLMDGGESVDSQSNGSAVNLGQKGVQMLLTTGMDTQTMLARDNDYRTLNAFKPSFSLLRILENVTFAQDFAEIIAMRLEKRRERRRQEQLRREQIIKLKQEAYLKLIKVCSDFIYKRQDLRSSFDTWLQFAEKESRAEVNAPHRSVLHRVDELSVFSEGGGGGGGGHLALLDGDYDGGSNNGGGLGGLGGYFNDDDHVYDYAADGGSMSLDELDSVAMSPLGRASAGLGHTHHQHHKNQQQSKTIPKNPQNHSGHNPATTSAAGAAAARGGEVDEIVMLGGIDATDNISALSNDFFQLHAQSSVASFEVQHHPQEEQYAEQNRGRNFDVDVDIVDDSIVVHNHHQTQEESAVAIAPVLSVDPYDIYQTSRPSTQPLPQSSPLLLPPSSLLLLRPSHLPLQGQGQHQEEEEEFYSDSRVGLLLTQPSALSLTSTLSSASSTPLHHARSHPNTNPNANANMNKRAVQFHASSSSMASTPTAKANANTSATSSPFLANDIVLQQMHQNRVISEEVKLAFHPWKPDKRSTLHEKIVHDDDKRYAEKQSHAVDVFLADYLEQRFNISAHSATARTTTTTTQNLKKTHQSALHNSHLNPSTVISNTHHTNNSHFNSHSHPNGNSSSALSAAASVLLLLPPRQKPLPHTGPSRDSKILFLSQRAAQAQKILVSLEDDDESHS